MGGGWHSDPLSRHQWRYWDGQRWTDHVADGGAVSLDPMPGPVHAPMSFQGVSVRDGVLSSYQGGGSIRGARASVETSGQIRHRITATRLVATGPLALAWRKRSDDRSVHLVVEGSGWAVVLQVAGRHETDARAFAAQINALSK